LHGRADVVTAIQAHHYLSRDGRKRATETCRELLSAGGIYITFENIRPRESEGIRTGMAVWKQFQLSQGNRRNQSNAHLERLTGYIFR
jgi:tRNA (cmo5U34)-methyltransferase